MLLVVCFAAAVLAQENGSQSPEIQKYSQEAVQALQANRPEVARREYQDILRLDPRNIDAQGNLGVIAFVQKDWARAAEEFRKALELDPELWRAKALLGLSELNLGQSADATALLSDAFPHIEEPKLRLETGMRLVDLLYQGGDLAKASSVVSALRLAFPEDIAVVYAAYRIYADQSYQAIDSMALLDAGSAQLHLALAEHLVNEGHLEGAIAEYRRAIDLNPDLAAPHYEVGEALLQESHSEPMLSEAQHEFERAQSLNPNDPRPGCERGKIEQWRGNPAAAYAHYSDVHKHNPLAPCANLGLGEVSIGEGKMQQALESLEAARQADPYDPEIRWRLASIYRQLGRKEEATKEVTAFQSLTKVRSSLQKAYQQTPPSK